MNVDGEKSIIEAKQSNSQIVLDCHHAATPFVDSPSAMTISSQIGAVVLMHTYCLFLGFFSRPSRKINRSVSSFPFKGFYDLAKRMPR